MDRLLYILAIYLPPNSSIEVYNAHALSIQHIVGLLSDFDIFLALGDYNLPNLRWLFDEDINGYLPSNASTEHELAMVEAMFTSGLQQVNHFVNVNGRLLDLAFANLPEHLDLIEPSVPFLPVDSDHQPYIVLLAFVVIFYQHVPT